MHNPVTLFLSPSASIRTEGMGYRNIFALVLPVKYKTCFHQIFPPHFLHFSPCLYGPRFHSSHMKGAGAWQLRTHTSWSVAPSCCSVRTQRAQGTWNGTTEHFSPVDDKMSQMIPGPFSLFPPHLFQPSVLHTRCRCSSLSLQTAGRRALSYSYSWRNIIRMTKTKVGSSCM